MQTRKVLAPNWRFFPLRQFVTDDARRSASDFRWWREGKIGSDWRGPENLENLNFSPPPCCMNFPFFAGGEGAKKLYLSSPFRRRRRRWAKEKKEEEGMDGERKGMHCYSQSVYPYARRFPPQADTVSKHILCMASFAWPSNGARNWIWRTFCWKNMRIKLNLTYLR